MSERVMLNISMQQTTLSSTSDAERLNLELN